MVRIATHTLVFLCMLIGRSEALPHRDVISENEAMADADGVERERRDVVMRATDFIPPVCRVMHETTKCLLTCGNTTMNVTYMMTDAKGSGIAYTTIYSNGLPSYSNITEYDGQDENGNNATFLQYSGICCSETVEITVIDKAGNMGKCPIIIRKVLPPTVKPTSSGSIITISLWASLIVMTLKSTLL